MGLEEKRYTIEPAQTAESYFIQVSRDYSALSTAQGMRIAQLCQRDGFDPAILRDMLIHDDKRIERIMTVAQIVHAHLGKGPDEDEMDFEETQLVIKSGFNVAVAVINVPIDQLGEMLALAAQYRGRDEAYRRLVWQRFFGREPTKEELE